MITKIKERERERIKSNKKAASYFFQKLGRGGGLNLIVYSIYLNYKKL
jgi:hypothetical protein